MSNLLQYKGYLGTIEYSAEDNLLHGKIAGITDLVSYDGESLEGLKNCFEKAVEDYLEMCNAEGLEPDKTSLDELQRQLSKSAEEMIKNYVAV